LSIIELSPANGGMSNVLGEGALRLVSTRRCEASAASPLAMLDHVSERQA
jgi:hypothetical protein